MRSTGSVCLMLLFSPLGALGCAAPKPPLGGVAYASAPPSSPHTTPARLAPALVTPSATQAAPPSVPRPSSDTLGSFGSAAFADEGPLLIEGSASDGRWVSICQARTDSDGDGKRAVTFGPRGESRGDALARYLLAPGQELVIDGLLSASPDGRYALVLQRGALVLWDNQSQQSTDLSALGADTRLSAESFAELRTAAFDVSSTRLLYVRLGEQGKRVVLRSLSDGGEREFDPGSGPIWRARLDPGGAFAVLEMITQDSNKNGRVDFPAPLLAAPRPCAASPGRFHTWTDRGDRPETVLLPLNGEPPVHEPDLVMPVADALLLRDSTGALLLERAGKRRLLEPAVCKGRVVHADTRRELFVIGCAQKKHTGRVSLELVTRSERKPLGIELASVELDRDVSDSPRLVVFYPGSDTVLFDADRRDLHPLQAGDVVIATRAARALVRRGKSLLFYDAETRVELALPFALDKYPDVLVTAPFAFVSPVLVNLETAQAVSVGPLRPLALSSQGQLLTAGSDAASSGLVDGPLRWSLPSL